MGTLIVTSISAFTINFNIAAMCILMSTCTNNNINVLKQQNSKILYEN